MLDILNIVFWAIFALEMVLKIVFFSPIAYFSERWNLLDVLVVIFGIIELVVDRTGLSAFRLCVGVGAHVMCGVVSGVLLVRVV